MTRRVLLCALGLSACGPAARELVVRGPAPQSALQCVEESALRLGYAVDPHGPSDRLRLERQLTFSDAARLVRWYRIEAKLQEEGEALDLYAGTLERYTDRQFTGHLVTPDPALQRDLAQIQQRCITTSPAT